MDRYKNEQQIEAVVSGFESCTTAKDEFKHWSHLTVAVYYLRELTADETVAKMRTGLFGFLDHHGVDLAKYNEELTRNWINLVQQVMQRAKPGESLVTIANRVLDELADSQLIKRTGG